MAQESFKILIQGELKGSLKSTVHAKKNYFHYFNNETRAGYLKSNVLLFLACLFISFKCIERTEILEILQREHAKSIMSFSPKEKLLICFNN